MRNVTSWAFWIIMVLALIFWLRGLESPEYQHKDLGNEIFIFEEKDNSATQRELQEDPLF